MLLEALARNPVERLVVASSMSLYGEGLYRDAGRQVAHGCGAHARAVEGGHDWESRPTRTAIRSIQLRHRNPSRRPASVYALSKFDQERMCLMLGRAYNIPTVALRFFNAYGARQALSNPYTGVLAILQRDC